MSLRHSILFYLASLALAVFVASPSQAAEDWQYDLFVYGLGASLDGTTGLGPIDADVDLSFDDVLDNLEMGGMVAFRAKKGRWAVMADAIYMGLGAANDRVDVDVDEVVFGIDGAYRFSDYFEFVFGVRFVDIDADIDFRGPLGLRASGGDSWVDPVLGMRVEGPIGEHWLFISRIDVGGFGLGSDTTYNFVLNFGYRFSDRTALLFGWRTIDIDYEDGEGLDRFAYDVTSSGPVVGLAFSF